MVSNPPVVAETKAPPQEPKPKVEAKNNVESTSEPMNFSDCVALQKMTADFMSGHTIIHVVNTSELSIVKYCAADGAIMITCSAKDSTKVATKTDNMKGC